MPENCPRCNHEMVLQKASPNFQRQSLYYCQKCQTTIFLPSESDHENKKASQDSSRRPKVLLVDDDTDLLTILELQFKTAGFDTITATNGEDAYSKLMDSSPDLVIADIFLPTMDGWDLSKKIRTNVQSNEIPIILITGIYTGPEFKTRALQTGVDAFITKPYDHDVLLNIARRLIASTAGVIPGPESSSIIPDKTG